MVHRKSHVSPQNVIKQCSLCMVCCECSYNEWSHFFPETINSHHYGTYTPTAFVQHLSNHESTYAFLLQDSATSHTKINSVCCVLSVFCDGIMSSILWPPCLPDVNSWDLWGMLKDIVVAVTVVVVVWVHFLKFMRFPSDQHQGVAKQR